MEPTVVQFSSQFPKISHNSRLIFLGSCFSTNVGNQLVKHKMDVLVNPFGTLFHPDAIANLLLRAMNEEMFNTEDFFERDNYWFSYVLGANSGKHSLEEAVSFGNEQLVQLRAYLKSAEYLILTLGTAYGYKINSKTVANCHKMPNNLFSKELSSVDGLIQEQSNLLIQLASFNPDLKVQYTVSPVRHIKEGLKNNSRSKSALVIVANELESKFDQVEYLPVYEFAVDELRSYSYYKSDGIHLNESAIELVFQRYIDWMMEEKGKEEMNSIQKLIGQLNHDSLYPKSNSNVEFLKKLVFQLESHQKEKGISWSAEIQMVNEKLNFLE